MSLPASYAVALSSHAPQRRGSHSQVAVYACITWHLLPHFSVTVRLKPLIHLRPERHLVAELGA